MGLDKGRQDPAFMELLSIEWTDKRPANKYMREVISESSKSCDSGGSPRQAGRDGLWEEVAFGGNEKVPGVVAQVERMARAKAWPVQELVVTGWLENMWEEGRHAPADGAPRLE